MAKANPGVDWYFDKPQPWQAEIKLLRAIPLACGLAEVAKWGSPCYTSQGKNVVLIHTFKEYCAYLFFKGALMKDPQRLLVQQTKNVQSARQIRFSDAKSITKLRGVLKKYVLQAIEVEASGDKVAMKGVSDYAAAEEFELRLRQLPNLKTAFHKLTPGRQKAYLLYFSGAKKSQTRAARVEKCLPRILEGLGLDD